MAWGLPLMAFDQWLKCLVSRTVSINEDLELRTGLVDLIHVRNPGVVLGFMSQLSVGLRPWFFLGLTLLTLGCICAILWPTARKSRLIRAVIVLVTVGALSNLIDRFRFGAVVDYLLVRLGGVVLPAFNLADIYIVMGLVGLIAHIFGEEQGAV